MNDENEYTCNGSVHPFGKWIVIFVNFMLVDIILPGYTKNMGSVENDDCELC